MKGSIKISSESSRGWSWLWAKTSWAFGQKKKVFGKECCCGKSYLLQFMNSILSHVNWVNWIRIDIKDCRVTRFPSEVPPAETLSMETKTLHSFSLNSQKDVNPFSVGVKPMPNPSHAPSFTINIFLKSTTNSIHFIFFLLNFLFKLKIFYFFINL